MTPNQVKGIITRAGKDTKIILLGDPQQIDKPFLDEKTNGLSYAAKFMKGSPYCWQITSAIGNHDESTGGAIDAVSAALILADKTDVRRNRVRNKDKASFDKHDRVNYAVTSSTVKVNPEKHVITLNLQIDEKICTMYEYFEIFLGRMMMCRRAAELLGTKFMLTANGSKVL